REKQAGLGGKCLASGTVRAVRRRGYRHHCAFNLDIRADDANRKSLADSSQPVSSDRTRRCANEAGWPCRQGFSRVAPRAGVEKSFCKVWIWEWGDTVRFGGTEHKKHKRHKIGFLSCASCVSCVPFPRIAIRDYILD